MSEGTVRLDVSQTGITAAQLDALDAGMVVVVPVRLGGRRVLARMEVLDKKAGTVRLHVQNVKVPKDLRLLLPKEATGNG